jgi:hypothetical protein
MDEIYNQKEAAVYLTDHGYPIHRTELSKMGRYGAGPKFARKGHQKLFHKDDLDRWLQEQSQRDRQ